MRLHLKSALFAALIIAPATTFAAEKTVKLSVPGMFCASCPYIVKGAIVQVEGVKDVMTDLKNKSAVVVFDDAQTSILEITKATAKFGYESSLAELDDNS